MFKFAIFLLINRLAAALIGLVNNRIYLMDEIRGKLDKLLVVSYRHVKRNGVFVKIVCVKCAIINVAIMSSNRLSTDKLT